MDGEGPESSIQIQDDFLDVLLGGTVTPGALKRAAELMVSSSLTFRIKALGILAAAGSRNQKEEAFSTLTRIFLDHKASLGMDERYDLVIILMQCVRDRPLWSGALRTLVFELAEDEGPHIRCDALVILWRLAEDGDIQALKILERARIDQHADVKHNATTFLKALGHA